jgi:hypothetical protein
MMTPAEPADPEGFRVIIMVGVGFGVPADLARSALYSPGPGLGEKRIVCPNLDGVLFIVKTHPLANLFFIALVVEF